ncbi:MAG: hypothetical protein J2P35_14160 [Actinobacteria bacterium]|nr:hypothetical protein [Actinomycetota bacterium]MBO0789011.1 hypothetical protein [Actinomycetota bacterium]MBO0818281.1 hypothetical protein [Actinomycetota bacterium]
MSTDVEDLLREGMERFTEGVRAPGGLARTACRQRRRRQAVRVAASCGTAMVTGAAAVAVTVGVTGSPAGTRAQTTAYVIKRVEKALLSQHLVFRGRTTSSYVFRGRAHSDGPAITWAYGPRNRFVEFTGNGCGPALPSGECSHRPGSERYLSQGTARIGGKLTTVYVTYYNREWSRVPGPTRTGPASACSSKGAIEISGLDNLPADWAAFIHSTLACGAADVTQHVRIDGMDTTKITGKPVTVRLPANQARSLRQKYLRVRWSLYVNPRTYLPVRMTGSNATFGGGKWGWEDSRSVTDVQWLPPTRTNTAQALVTIPAGFHQVSSPAQQ